MLDQELLEMLFEELELDFEKWVSDVGYTSEWTDQQIYNALPEDILPWIADIVMNASWYHDGM